jgi:predicted transcriptional regulator
MPDAADHQRLLALTAQIVAAHVSNNGVAPDSVPALISSVFHTLSGIENVTVEAEKQEPAVPVKKSVFPDYLVCLEDGKKLKMLKRHLRTAYNMTPEQYREKWGLPSSYPMVAPDYAAKRSTLAKKIGLGTKRGMAELPPPPPEPARPGRPRKTAAKAAARR